MRLITLCTAITVWLLTIALVQAQEAEVSEQIQLLEATKERVISEEKESLKAVVEGINIRVERNEISEAEATSLKEKAAEKHALNIENRLAILDNKIALLERNGDPSVVDDDDDRFILRISSNDDDDPFIYIGRRNPPRKYDRRTTSDFVLAVGFNNVIADGALGDDTYKLAGSRFAEIGWAWKTRVFRETNWLRVKYGFSFQFNGLKPTDNRYFVDTGDQTELQTFPVSLDKSKFRIDNLVIPVHFEMGPSKKIEREDYFRYSTHNKVKIGIGGYAGIKLGTRQKLRFDEMGQTIEQKEKGDFNTNNFIYGVSGYFGWRDTAVYIKYDLNSIFENDPLNQRNISLGLRFDMD